MYCDLWSKFIKVQKLFKGGNYSSEETIRGRKLFKGGNYSQKKNRYLFCSCWHKTSVWVGWVRCAVNIMSLDVTYVQVQTKITTLLNNTALVCDNFCPHLHAHPLLIPNVQCTQHTPSFINCLLTILKALISKLMVYLLVTNY